MHIPKFKIFTTLAIISILLILIIIQPAQKISALKINLLDTSTPALKALGLSLAASKRLIPFARLREENIFLKKSLDETMRKLEEMKSLYYENQRLRSLLDFRKALPYATIPAQVIGRDPSNWSNSLILDKGLNDGVKQNRAVLSAKGLVGRTVEVGRRSSKILLITDPNSKVGVLIPRNSQGGILLGRPDGRCKMIYISLDSDTAIGDEVLTAGFGSIFPKGILVGRVIKVSREPGRLYSYAIVIPAQDLSRVEEILCIR